MIIEIERFIKVVEYRSISKAAQALFITQPALSLSLSRLEKELGAKLLNRSNKRLDLTKDGETVYNFFTKILDLWERAKDPTARRNSNGQAIISLGLFDNAAIKLSRYFQKTLKEKKYQLEITIDRSAYLLRGIQTDLFDIVVCVLPQQTLLSPTVIRVCESWEELAPVSGKKWKAKLEHIPFILYNKNSETRSYIDEAFFQKGIHPKVLVESTSPSFMKELAIGGFGVALLPYNFVEREIKSKKLYAQKLNIVFKRKIGVLVNGDGNTEELQSFAKEIIHCLT